MVGLWPSRKNKTPQPATQPQSERRAGLVRPATRPVTSAPSATTSTATTIIGTQTPCTNGSFATRSLTPEGRGTPIGAASQLDPLAVNASLSGYTTAGSESTVQGRAYSGGEHPPSLSNIVTASRAGFAPPEQVEVDRKRKGKRSGSADLPASMYAGEGRRCVGYYEILDTLGWGYSGKVKRGRDLRTGELVALKIMEKGADGDRARRTFDRLQMEIQAMRACDGHPHTVKLIHADFHAKYPKKDGSSKVVNLLVMELCENGELFDLLSKVGPVDDAVCKVYFHQLILGIHYLHGNMLCHRDLKPENLLLDRNFSLKIADFGFSTRLGHNHLCSSIVGSKTYMAPEVIAGYGYDPQKVDVWSAGVILFTMLAGHPPMEIARESDWWFRALKLKRHDLFWQSHEREREPFPPDAKMLINSMLATTPTDRITVAEILDHVYLAERREAMLGFRTSPEDGLEAVRALMAKMRASALVSKRPCYTSPGDSSRGTVSSGTSTSTRSPVSAQSRSPVLGYAAPGPSASAGMPSVAFTAAYAGGEAVCLGDGGAGEAGSAFYGGQQGRYWSSSQDPFSRNTHRSSQSGEGESLVWEEGVVAPVMRSTQAMNLTGGFIARGRATDVVEEIERALAAMGMEFPGADGRGRSGVRSSFKITGVMTVAGGLDTGKVKVVVQVYRILSDDDYLRKLEGVDVPEEESGGMLVVSIRRREGSHKNFAKVEKSLVESMMSGAASNGARVAPTY